MLRCTNEKQQRIKARVNECFRDDDSCEHDEGQHIEVTITILIKGEANK